MDINDLVNDIKKFTRKPRTFDDVVGNEMFSRIDSCVDLKNPLVKMWFVNTVTLAVHYRLNDEGPETLFYTVGTISYVTEKRKHPINQGRFQNFLKVVDFINPDTDALFKHTDALLSAVKTYKKTFNLTYMKRYAELMDAESFNRPTKLIGSFKFIANSEFLDGQQNALRHPRKDYY